MSRYVDPRYDTTFKKVFGEHSDLLISFINAMLPLEGDEIVQEIEYLSPELMPPLPDIKYSVVDVRCKDKRGHQFLVEMQMVWTEDFKSRVLFNASKAYVTQLHKGEDYELLEPVYSLNIVNDTVESELPKDQFYHYYQMVHACDSNNIIKGLHIAFIELPKFNPQTPVEKEMQRLWLRFLTEINEYTRKAPEELLANPLTNKAVELMEEWGMTDVERCLYERNIDSVRIENAIIRGTKRHAMEKGMKKGLEKGLEKGRAEANKENAQKMLAAGIDKKTILEITGVEIDEA
ncbi:MAG: Rpn family recombination-promoting nuclease/putative transposase [Bacteroidales bacterium]|nr:Rpn family recombination-promoting nuclease/putative transposase [Bacteroidales bacterium]